MNILFKYRSLHNQYHVASLTDSAYYFSKFSEFNDPFEGNVEFSSNVSNDDFSDKLDIVSFLRKAGFVLSTSNFDSLRDDEKQDCLNFIRSTSIFSIWSEIDKHWGVLSLSKLPDNVPMWAHYANNHKGFCVGIDIDRLLETYPELLLLEVSYGELSHKIDFSNYNKLDMATLQTLLGRKHEQWSYEKEFRLVMECGNQRTLFLPPECISRIIFGINTPNKMLEKWVEFIKKQYPNANIELACAFDGAAGLKLSPITNAVNSGYRIVRSFWENNRLIQRDHAGNKEESIRYPVFDRSTGRGFPKNVFLYINLGSTDDCSTVLNCLGEFLETETEFYEDGYYSGCNAEFTIRAFMVRSSDWYYKQIPNFIKFRYDRFVVITGAPTVSTSSFSQLDLAYFITELAHSISPKINDFDICFGRTMHCLPKKMFVDIWEISFRNPSALFGFWITLVQHSDANPEAEQYRIYSEGFINFDEKELIVVFRKDQEDVANLAIKDLFTEVTLAGESLGGKSLIDSGIVGSLSIENTISSVTSRPVYMLDLRNNQEIIRSGAEYCFLKIAQSMTMVNRKQDS